MGEAIKDIATGMPLYMHIVLWVSVALVVASFCIPPYAQIDSSVIAAVGELMGGAWLFYLTASIPTYLEKGAKIRATKGDTVIEINGNEQ